MKYKKEIKSYKQREIHFKVSLKDKHVLFAMFTIEHKKARQTSKKIYKNTLIRCLQLK